jgi:hypothetical protein
LYWEKLKCLGEIWRMWLKFPVTLEGQRGVQGVLSRVLTNG